MLFGSSSGGSVSCNSGAGCGRISITFERVVIAVAVVVVQLINISKNIKSALNVNFLTG